MHLNEFGSIAEAAWRDIPNHFRGVQLDAGVVMPNHIHVILILAAPDRRGAACRAPTPIAFGPPKPESLATIVRSFKSAVTRQSNRIRGTPGAAIWQRNYYEHIVRNEQDLRTIRDYIADNPARWADDKENPAKRSRGAR